MRQNRSQTVAQLTAQYNARPSRNASQHTREHLKCAIDQWKGVTWSDESGFVFHYAHGRVRIHRLPDVKLLPPCTADHIQAVGGNIMLRETFIGASLGSMVVVE